MGGIFAMRCAVLRWQ